jgi:hypothetical protein
MAKNENQSAISINWWKEPKNEKHKYIYEIVSRIHHEQISRMEKNLRSLQLYGNSDMVGGTPYTYSKLSTPMLPENRVKLNIIASMCDTVGAKISKMKPRVMFLTSGGDSAAMTQAKKLSKFVLGAFYKNDIYKLHQQGFRGATVMDIGALKHYVKDGDICSETVMATELYVDPADSLYGKPTSLYQVKYINKDILMEMFPNNKADIIRSAHTIEQQGYDPKIMSEFCAVIEAWHLPVNKDGKFGVHCITVENGTLLEEPYTKEYFPFTFFRWAPMLFGFWGQSLSERLTGNQIEINKMLRIIQKSFHLGSAFKVFLEYGSKVAREHLNNEIGSIVYYTGQKPEFYVPKTVHEEFFRHLEWLVKSSYEEAGISQMSAQSVKPAGLESGVALRTYNDIETERFSLVSQAYEASFLETARQYIDLAEDIAAEGGDFEVMAQSKKFIESVKWSEVKLEKNAYIMQMFPVSMLPHEPAGRLSFVQELMQQGMISQEEGRELLDFPDLESYTNLKTAARRDLQNTLDNILEKGEYQTPEPFQDLQNGIVMFQSAYLDAKMNKVDEEKLDMIRTWISQAQAMMAKAQLGNQQSQMLAQGQPQATGAQGGQASTAAPAPDQNQPAIPPGVPQS